MKKITSKVISLVLGVAMLVGLIPLILPFHTVAASQTVLGDVVTSPGATENVKYFKEDTSFDLSNRTDTPQTFEFELAGCANIAGADNGGVIIGNYSEDASSYINVEAVDYGKLIVRGKHNGGSEWKATFYQSEADIRTNAVHHYTVTVGAAWAGVSLYVDGVHKATRYPASLTLPVASEYISLSGSAVTTETETPTISRGLFTPLRCSVISVPQRRSPQINP